MVNENNYAALNDKKYIEAREKWFSRMESFFEGKADGPFRLNGSGIYLPENPSKDINAAIDAALARMNPEALMDNTVFRPLFLQYHFYNTHLVDNIFGAEVFERDRLWYSKHLNKEVGSLEKPDLEKNEAWVKLKGHIKYFLDKKLALPLISIPCISSPLNVAVNLFGEDFLVSMCLETEKAMHDLRLICDIEKEMHLWFINNIPAEQLTTVIGQSRTMPRGYGQICGCTSQLISADFYSEMIAPLDAELLGLYKTGGMIHLCGSHTQHIPEWRKMKELRVVQINDRATEDLEKYFYGLRDDQIIYYRPCEKMPVEKALEITGGKRLVIMERN